MRALGYCLLAGLLLCLPAADAGVWEDRFDTFQPENWTAQTGGVRLWQEPPPAGAIVRDGALLLKEPLCGVRLTSWQKFLYGTLEARVRIRPAGSQYFGFMSRAPWGSNNLSLMSEPGGWQTMLARDGKGGYAGIAFRPPADPWYTLKIVWQPSRVAIYVNDRLQGEVADAARIPHTAMPIILDVSQPNVAMEFDWIRVTGSTFSGERATLPPPAAKIVGKPRILTSADWRVTIDPQSGVVHEVASLRPTPQAWTPESARAVDLYIRDFPDGEPVRFVRKPGGQPAEETGSQFCCLTVPETAPRRGEVEARFTLTLCDNRLSISSRLTALCNLRGPVEIGLGMPFRPAAWRRQLLPRNPWLVLDPRQPGPVRLPFMADPDDATVANTAGGWNFYPFGILDGRDRQVLWGGMDLGRRMVLSPGNFGSLPAVTLAPKVWRKGETRSLEFSAYSFPKAEKDFPAVLRWYLCHATSSDPLTRGLFPVRDFAPRMLPAGGGVGMPDLRISRMNPKADAKFFDAVCEKLRRFNLPNLWFDVQLAVDGSHPTSGKWYNHYGLPLSAAPLRAEVQRLKALGLRPCTYTNQFIMPELLRSGGKPDKNWVAYDATGQISSWAVFSADSPVAEGDFFTKDLAGKLGTGILTWAYGDYGLDAFRNWYVGQVTAAVDYYQPSGLSWDYGWSGMGPNQVCCRSNPRTTLAHGTLRAQAEIAAYLRRKYPQMTIIVNDAGGSPSELLANCVLMENTDKMSDVDFLAAKALVATMSSMDYFADHDRPRWTRQIMLDLARGCSFGAPFWVLMTPPEADYIATWTSLLDFSGRTTSLPAMAEEEAVACLSGGAPEDLVGTVWCDGRRLMAAFFDRRRDGGPERKTVALKVPKGFSPATAARWRICRLSRLAAEVSPSAPPDSNWKVDRSTPGRILLSGPLAAGEMVLFENPR
jgi:hypothetical protein